MPDFIPGLQLSEVLYRESVAPVLAREFPGLVHSAARIGTGSDVLGFDTDRSTDHEWGPRLLLFLADRKSTRLNSSHLVISYAVFCLKKQNNQRCTV